MEDAVIVSAARTPIGSFNGSLSNVPAPKLGSIAITEALTRAHVPKEKIDEVIMGCVLTAAMGQAPARQAAIFAGLPPKVHALTVDKVCSSGLKAVMLAAQSIWTGESNFVVAGGMENMSLAPHALTNSRKGYRLGHFEVYDTLIKDGLWDVYNQFHMGNCAELCAREKKISKEMQDAYAAQSYKRAQKAMQEGLFKKELTPVSIADPRGGAPTAVTEDEEPLRMKIEKISSFKPAFEKGGTVTAGNASKINDAAAALVIMSGTKAKELGIKPLARIMAQATHSQAPEWFTTAPAGAIRRVLQKAGLELKDIDLFEINEAFAVVALAVLADLKLSADHVNVRGGAIALGHPIGGSGARLLTTLLHTMIDTGTKRGIASLCNGGGEATALLIETVK